MLEESLLKAHETDTLFPSPTPEVRSNCFNKKKCWKYLDIFVNDVLIIFFSVSDIILDMLVCRRFYLNEQYSFFYVSLSIFLFARKFILLYLIVF